MGLALSLTPRTLAVSLLSVPAMVPVKTTAYVPGVIVAETLPNLPALFPVDLTTGSVVAHLAFKTGVEEVFDVQVLPQIVSPHISGPWADRDTGRPFWTVPPAASTTRAGKATSNSTL